MANMDAANRAEPKAAMKMRAITQDRYGLPDVLELRQLDRPEPGDGEVRIRVRASSLNMYDWHMITGTPYMARTQAGWGTPKNPVPGSDVAGVVESVGEKSARFRPGDEVFGFIGNGALAEFVCVGEQRLVTKSANLTFEQAAATPLAGLTALESLRDVGGLQPGQRVLINGASGGVGTFAVQIAKVLGADVTAVCSTTKVDLARSIGADHVVDYTRENFVATERGYDVLLDNVGDRPWSETRRVLTPNGINVTITGPKHRWLGPFRRLIYRKVVSSFGSQRMTWFTARARREDLEYLADLLAAGAVTPVIEATYPLDQAKEGLRHLGEGHAAGKLVITV